MGTDPVPGGRRRRPRAVAELHRAPVSTCPHCGRDTKTVSGGVCADCWGIKDPDRAVDLRRPPRTSPLIDWDPGVFGWDNGYHVIALGVALVLVVIGVALGLR